MKRMLIALTLAMFALPAFSVAQDVTGAPKKRLLLITESRGFVHSVVARPSSVVAKGAPNMDGLEFKLNKNKLGVSFNGRLTKPLEIVAIVKPCLVEKTFMELAEKTGLFEVDCSQNSRAELTSDNLKNYDAVFFYTTGELPLTDAQKIRFARFRALRQGLRRQPLRHRYLLHMAEIRRTHRRLFRRPSLSIKKSRSSRRG